MVEAIRFVEGCRRHELCIESFGNVRGEVVERCARVKDRLASRVQAAGIREDV